MEFRFVRIGISIIITLFFGQALVCQDLGVIENTDSRLFQFVEGNDTIDFIKFSKDTLMKKPVLLMLQGSLPIPLAVKYSEEVHFTSFPFKLTKEFLEVYHIVVISMPTIPVLVDQDEISNNGSYKKVSTAYNKANYLQNYVDRANFVINYLSKQRWVQYNEFVLFGHSQGAYVAIKVAKENSKVSSLGISSCSPYGRFHQYIRKVRAEEQQGGITSIEAQNKIEDYYKRWNYISRNRNDDSQERGDTYKATYSFSENFVDDLMELEIPIFITYGTKDIGALGCDMLPIEFDKINKENYKMKAYPGLGHNFEEIGLDGSSNYNKMYWDDVFQEFVNWVKQ